MGFFKKLVKAANPVNLVKNPKEAAKFATKMTVDPMGTVIRTGTDTPMTLRGGLDPTGKLLMPEQAAPPARTPYQGRPMQLSAGAQALYDQMKQRTATRMAAQQAPQQAAAPSPQPAVASGAAGLMGRAVSHIQQQQAQPPLAIGGPQQGMRIPRTPTVPMAMADGGTVEGEGCERYESKAFTRKPNGKPYGK